MMDMSDTFPSPEFNRSSELLQRAAAGLVLRAIRDIGADVRLGDLTDENAMHLAAGAIAAIRAGDKRQIEVAWWKASEGAEPAEVYQAMIDAILAE